MKIFVIEGPIGVGKSTILQSLEKRGLPVYFEPIEEWKPLLENFYQSGGSPAAAIILQRKILDTIVTRATNIRESNHDVVVMERSFLSGLHVFVAANKQLSPHEEWGQIEEEYLNQVTQFENKDTNLIRIGLNCPFDTALIRSRQRGDPDVTGTSDYHRLIYNLSAQYEAYCDYKVSTCDTISLEHVVSNVCAIINQNIS